jgi:RNA polymerase sigma factor (sigma-70 family)
MTIMKITGYARPPEQNASGAGSPTCTSPSAEARTESVERLFREHNRSLVSYLAARLNSVQEAKEVAQEAYVRLLQLDQPGAESFLKAYLFRVATNLALDRLRRRVRQGRFEQTEVTADLDPGFNEPERQLLAQEVLRSLLLGLEELPDRCREAFLLFRLDGLSQEAIATRLGVTERMVRNYINQALIYCRLRIDGATPEKARERTRR